MNGTQIQTTLAPIVAAIAGFLAGKGYFGWDAQTWIAILGGLGTVAATIWGAVAARKQAIVQQALSSDKATMVSAVADMPEVKRIELAVTPTSVDLEAKTPSNVVLK